MSLKQILSVCHWKSHHTVLLTGYGLGCFSAFPFGANGGCSADTSISRNNEIHIDVHIVYIFFYINCDELSSEGLFLSSGTELISQSRSVKKGGSVSTLLMTGSLVTNV